MEPFGHVDELHRVAVFIHEKAFERLAGGVRDVDQPVALAYVGAGLEDGLAQVLGGVLGWWLPIASAWPLYDVHRALGVATVLVIGWKQVIALRSLRKHPDWAPEAIALAVLVALSLTGTCLAFGFPDPSSPLRGMDNVFLSPHVAGVSEESEARLLETCADNMRRVLDGLEPFNVVNGVGRRS